MLLSYFNHCPQLGRGRRLRRAIVASERVPRRCERRGNIDGKNDRDSFCSSCFFCAFHSSRINFLCFFLTTHLTTTRASLTQDAFGQFLFRCADESGSRRVLNPKTARARLTSINSDVTFLLESLRSWRTSSPSLPSFYLSSMCVIAYELQYFSHFFCVALTI